MHPLDIVESDRGGDPVYGLKPELTLKQHARRALDRVFEWLRVQREGRVVRTCTGDPRVMPYSLRLLARQYVYDHLDRDSFTNDDAWQFARRYYVYALEVALGNIIEVWSLRYGSDWPEEYQDLVALLRLEEE